MITGLDIALQRINQIERNFSEITKTETTAQAAPNIDFEAVLNDRMTNGTSFIRNNSANKGTANTHYDSKFTDLVKSAAQRPY